MCLAGEILFERELTLVGSICRHNTDEFFLIDDLGQQRRGYMAFITNQGKIQSTVIQILENIASPPW